MENCISIRQGKVVWDSGQDMDRMEHRVIIIIYRHKKSQDHRKIDGKGPQQSPILFHFSTFFPFPMDICPTCSERSPPTVGRAWHLVAAKTNTKMYEKFNCVPKSCIPVELWTQASFGLFCVTVSVEQLLQDVSWQLLPDACHYLLCCLLGKDLHIQQVMHSVSHISLPKKDPATPCELALLNAVNHQHSQRHKCHAPFWDVPVQLQVSLSLSVFMLPSHNKVFTFFLFPFSATLLAKLFFTLPSSPNWHICSHAQTITSLRKCQFSLTSFLSSLPWNLSRVVFSIHLSSDTQSLMRSSA